MSDKYGLSHDPYCYPGSNVLVNELGISEQTALDAAEAELTQWRMERYEPPDFGDFSLAALQSIHFYLFHGLYSWAGQLRTVDISKGNTRFANVARIEAEVIKFFHNLGQEGLLKNLPQSVFVARLAYYYSELNVIHPFRDGNGRAQRVLFEILAINAGFELRWEPIERSEWVHANIAAYNCQLDPLITLLTRAIIKI